MTDLKQLHARAFAHRSYDKNMSLKWFIAHWTIKETITLEEKEESEAHFKKLKQEKINWLQEGELVFVGMGMQNDTELGNFRFRTEIQNKEGQRFFIELGSDWKTLRIDHSIDQDQARLYESKLQVLTRIPNLQLTKQNQADYDKYSKQPYHRYRTEEAEGFIFNKKPTKKLVLDLVNMLYDTKFKTMEIDNYFLRTEDYISKG